MAPRVWIGRSTDTGVILRVARSGDGLASSWAALLVVIR
jgi:hypothetical protein